MRTVIADILLAAAAVLVVISSAGILLMRNAYRKLHYVTPAALVAPLLVGLAVLAQSGWSINSGLTWLALAFIVVATPILSHTTIRAARIRQEGDWRAGHDRRTPP
jgi:multicomponent Na+:H+ antiporter subunit G